jgi:hypothetical protein
LNVRGGRISPLWRTAFIALALLAGGREEAAAQDSLEEAVKATFLYRFGSFVEWPPNAFADAAAPLVICVAGEPAFAQLVAQSAGGERVAGRAVEVRRVDVVMPASGCHILYLAYARRQSVIDALQATAGDPVLTVTDSRFGDTRGVIHFVVVRDRVRFHIDDARAASGNLFLSSRLLALAVSVRRRAGS